MFNVLPDTKEKFLNLKNLPLNENVDKLSDDRKLLSTEMNKITTSLRDLINKIDYDSIKPVPMSEEFNEYKKLPKLDPVKVDGESFDNAIIVIEGNKKAIERLNLYKDAVIKMYEEYPLVCQYVTLNTDLLILNHKGHILSIQKYIDKH